MNPRLSSPHEEWDELAAGYALDALEPADERAFLAHLDGCADCRRALDDHSFVAAQLGALADEPETVLPAWTHIRGGVIDQRAPAPVADEPAVAAPRRSRVVSLEARRRTRARVLGAAAAAVAVVAAGTVTWQLSTGNTSGPTVVSQCRSSPATCHVVALRSGGRQSAVVLVRDGTARLVPTSLSAPRPGHTYALWQLRRTGGPQLLAEHGPGTSPPVHLVYPYVDTTAFAVSEEPTGTVPTTPTRVIAVGAVPA